MGKKVARLFDQFQPEHYRLHLAPDRDAMTFSGSVTITGKKVGRPSQRLTLHQKDLKIASAIVTKHDKSGDQPVVIERINNQNSLNEVRLHSNAKIYPGSYSITLEFHGVITKQMNGIYPCDFKHAGQQKQLIATQFESHHAREAFPCIDEPEAKAIFELSLATPSNETVIANTPVKSSVQKDKNIITTFEDTPRMSTYLLAFVYGELDYREAKTTDGITIRTYATPDNAELTEFGLDVAVKCLEFFSDYFDVPYPLQKLDMVALPDFSSGAMENWGLVTYRETAMLADSLSTSIESKQMVALVICHELSHQWFGNLVTMKWWDDLWLNESFANMMEYQAVDALFPDWHIWEQFVAHEGVSAKRRDSLSDVQSVHTPVLHPDEISTLFDPSIVYAKGGTVLYMLKNYIGDYAFRSGLKEYFKLHAYSNTVADDLWDALSRSSGQDIRTFMQKWLHEPGYPLVTVDWQPGLPSIKLSQQRFSSDPAVDNTDTQPWHVPLAATGELDVASQLFTAPSASLELQTVPKTLLLNHDGTSYFIPYYSQNDHVASIVKAIEAGHVSIIDRFLLLDNYVMLQRSGACSTTDLLDLITAYAQETSETVWGAITMAIGEARKLIEFHDDHHDYLDTVIRTLVVPLAEQLTWDDSENDTAQTLRLRSLCLSLAAGAKHQPTITEGLRRFAAFKTPADLAASTRGIVYYIGARHGTDDDFTKLVDLYKEIQNADEKDEIAGGITSVDQPKRYRQALGLLKSDDIRRQDLMHWYAWLLRNRHSREAAWQWLVDNWQWLEQEFASDKSYSYFARFGGGVFSRQDELQRYHEFFSTKQSIALARDIKLAEQEIASRIAWRYRNEAAVMQWLSHNS